MLFIRRCILNLLLQNQHNVDIIDMSIFIERGNQLEETVRNDRPQAKDNIHNICSCGSALCGGDIQLQDQLRYVEVPSGRFIGKKGNGDNVRRIRRQLRDNSDVRRA